MRSASILSLTVATICISGVVAQGQTATTPQIYDGTMAKPPANVRVKLSADEFRLTLLQRLLEADSPLTVGRVQLHRMGDQAAVDLMKIMGTRSPLNGGETSKLLEMINAAYEKPAAILNASDRQPKATLFLLQVLDSTTQDQGIKGRIAEVKQYVQAVGSGTDGN